MPNPSVRVKLLKPWKMIDGTVAPRKVGRLVYTHHVEVAAGEYELEVIRNPHLGFTNPWFVLKGTKTGWACGSWLQWCNGAINRFGQPIDWEEWEIQVWVDGRRLDASFENIWQTGHAWEF